MSNPSVVASHWQPQLPPERLAPEVVDFLSASGVTTVFSGHVPHGDAPMVSRQDGLAVITMDTSYSNNVIYEGAPKAAGDGTNRGPVAVPVAVVEARAGAPPRVELEAVLATGKLLQASLPDCPYTGSYVDGWLVKGTVEGRWLLTQVQGFTVTNRLVDSVGFEVL
mmetsp:Transcript_73880/g.169318  ORF Transcript_73880/g.169318 Transcript_73880/m.169318 type:complete len:166 (+) Transcript_73880:2-499(+)